MGSRYAKRASQNGWESRTNRRARGNIRSFIEVSRDRRLFEMTWAIGSRRRDVKVHSYHAIVRLCHACRSATPGRLQVHLVVSVFEGSAPHAKGGSAELRLRAQLDGSGQLFAGR